MSSKRRAVVQVAIRRVVVLEADDPMDPLAATVATLQACLPDAVVVGQGLRAFVDAGDMVQALRPATGKMEWGEVRQTATGLVVHFADNTERPLPVKLKPPTNGGT